MKKSKKFYDVQKAYDNGVTGLLMGGEIREEGLFREKDVLAENYSEPLLSGKNEIKKVETISGACGSGIDIYQLEFKDATIYLSKGEYVAGLVGESEDKENTKEYKTVRFWYLCAECGDYGKAVKENFMLDRCDVKCVSLDEGRNDGHVKFASESLSVIRGLLGFIPEYFLFGQAIAIPDSLKTNEDYCSAWAYAYMFESVDKPECNEEELKRRFKNVLLYPQNRAKHLANEHKAKYQMYLERSESLSNAMKFLEDHSEEYMYLVVDNSKCGKGEAYDSERQEVLKTFISLKEAYAFAKTQPKKTAIEIEQWDGTGNTFIQSFTIKEAETAVVDYK